MRGKGTKLGVGRCGGKGFSGLLHRFMVRFRIFTFGMITFGIVSLGKSSWRHFLVVRGAEGSGHSRAWACF